MITRTDIDLAADIYCAEDTIYMDKRRWSFIDGAKWAISQMEAREKRKLEEQAIQDLKNSDVGN